MYFSAAASFYSPVRLVAVVVGLPARVPRLVRKQSPNVDLQGLETRKGGKTFRWGGKYHANMNSRDTLLTELGVVGEHPAKVPGAYSDSKLVFLANSPPAVQMGFIDQLPQRKLTVADTMDLWINMAKDDLLKLLKRSRRRPGAELRRGRAADRQAQQHRHGRAILELGPRFVVIKRVNTAACWCTVTASARCPRTPPTRSLTPPAAAETPLPAA